MKKSCIILLFVCVTLMGCAATPMYYWGDYSDTLYEYKKTPNDETLNAVIKSLDDIIQESKKRNTKVPPGVYAELGGLMIKQGNVEKGRQLFRQEADLYPESQTFMRKVLEESTKGEKK